MASRVIKSVDDKPVRGWSTISVPLPTVTQVLLLDLGRKLSLCRRASDLQATASCEETWDI